jgi:hypothetical protein
VASLEPATHAYTFWEGIPHEARCCFGELFARSRTLRVGAAQHGLAAAAAAAAAR